MTAETRSLNAKVWERGAEDWYVEPVWVSRRLFEIEEFVGGVWDPACGIGNIIAGANLSGIQAVGTDLVSRSQWCSGGINFLHMSDMCGAKTNVVSNPPFDLSREFALHALNLVPGRGKVAMIYPIRRLNAAGAWLRHTPLKRVLFLTPRPSMPPGDVYEKVIAAGKKPSGGKQDFCWLVWERGYIGPSQVSWLHRDKGKSDA